MGYSIHDGLVIADNYDDEHYDDDDDMAMATTMLRSYEHCTVYSTYSNVPVMKDTVVTLLALMHLWCVSI